MIEEMLFKASQIEQSHHELGRSGQPLAHNHGAPLGDFDGAAVRSLKSQGQASCGGSCTSQKDFEEA